MAQYPGTENETRIAFDRLASQVGAIFSAAGMSISDAALVADSLATADARGIHSHGVMRVPDYVHKILDLGVDPMGVPRVVSDRQAAIVVDGANTLGQIGAVFAMDAAISRARDTGVAFVALGGSNHCGAMDYYVRRAVDAGMIGIAMTNALPTMAPWGGVDKIVGLNPVAMGFPAGEESDLLLDIALGATAHGKIEIYHQKDQPIPPDWAFDVDGKPTTDAAAALDGLIQPIGKFKGIGLAMGMGILSTLLSGAAYGSESGNMIDGPVAGVDGQSFVAINISAFVSEAVFRQRIDRIIREFRGSTMAAATTRIYLPGELEYEFELAYRRDGIPLNGVTLNGLHQAAARVNCRVELPGRDPD